MKFRAATTLLLLALTSQPAVARTPASPQRHHVWSHQQVVVPHSWRNSSSPREGEVLVRRIHAEIDILDQTATTRLTVELHNPTRRAAEASLLIPVPDDIAIGKFEIDGKTEGAQAQLMQKGHAKEVYDQIVRTMKDPGVLEFVGFDMIATSVFPVPAYGEQAVRITYDQVLPLDGERIDFVLPRSESFDAAVPWTFDIDLRSATPISTIYSPSHEMKPVLRGANRIQLVIEQAAAAEPGPFRLSYLREQEGVTASIIACPDPELGGGTFLLLAGLPTDPDVERDHRKREVTIVLDTSGSMADGKLDQARTAAFQVLAGLGDQETFNVLAYSDEVRRFRPAPVARTKKTLAEVKAFLDQLRPAGGTNIHEALSTALAQAAPAKRIPLVLFLTDGLPTVGEKSETAIRALVENSNAHERRVFTFGVGLDVNVPLLDRIAEESRASSAYVLPDEDVEVAVAAVFKKLTGPVLSAPKLAALDRDGKPAGFKLHDVYPRRIPDMFEGDQLVLMGRYDDGAPLDLVIEGEFLGETKRFSVRFDPARANSKNTFVPRLWAGRKIAYLTDQMRQAGADVAARVAGDGIGPFEELSDEVLRLSMRYGVLSEFTAFLAKDGTNLTAWSANRVDTNAFMNSGAVNTRSGLVAYNTAVNYRDSRDATRMSRFNGYWTGHGERVQTSAVQQIGHQAFFRRGQRWIDSRAIRDDEELTWSRRVVFGSDEHRELVDQLVAEGRQSILALDGEILLKAGDEVILIVNESAEVDAAASPR